MLDRIRLAMQAKTLEKTSGTAEIDETFVGGKIGFMKQAAREREGITTRSYRPS
jgi:hypothetical protein